MASTFRSEEMSLCQLFLQTESAYAIVAELGELGVAQFRDLNPSVSVFQRKYVNEVRRCDEMERRLRFIETEIKRDNIRIPDCDDNTAAPVLRELLEIESTLEKVENDVREVNTNMVVLKQRNNELVELMHILRMTQQFFETGRPPTEEEIIAASTFDYNHPGQGPESNTSLGLTCMSGVILRDRVENFERMLWRTSRGNIYLRYMDIGSIEDPKSNEMVDKCVFILFFPGKQLEPKVKKICDAFHATLYPNPDDAEARRERMDKIVAGLSELETVLKESKDHRRRILIGAAKYVSSWFNSVRKVKSIYHTLNLFNLDVTQKCLIAECWIPVIELDAAQKALSRGTDASGGSVTSIINRLETVDESPPTFNKLNKFTTGFQTIVDAYGVANYREVNPMPFTVITFPFLFAVMFGDVGHGLIMFFFSLILVVKEKQLAAMKIRDEIFNTFFSGRYIIMLMGLFAVYTGMIYNDMFSKSINVFGSTWQIPEDINTQASKTILDPNSNAFMNTSYPFGMDPMWNLAMNKLNFLNSFKMKMSVIVGIIHMILGVCLSFFNYKFFRSKLDIFCQFIPQLIFLCFIFLYLCVMIMYKWIVFPAGPTEMAVGYYPGSHCAPSLLIGLISMFMPKGNRTEGFGGATCYLNAYYPHQGTVERVLLIGAIICVPWMLMIKPFVLRYQNSKRNRQQDYQLTVITHDMDGNDTNGSTIDIEKGEKGDKSTAPIAGQGHGHGEGEFSFGEVFIHQAIHTIEYCLGCISHTASYLRLWALSLAHAELSEVLWTMVMRIGFNSSSHINSIVLFVIFFAFGSLTIAILVVMEGLSAFLHALRLHWVEFQSKFYGGTGYAFEPFSFKIIFEMEQEAAELDLE